MSGKDETIVARVSAGNMVGIDWNRKKSEGLKEGLFGRNCRQQA